MKTVFIKDKFAIFPPFDTIEPTLNKQAIVMNDSERIQKKWEQTDHTYEGFTNPVTYLAWLYIQQDNKHMKAAEQLLRKDDTINPNRLASYGKRYIEIDEGWEYHPDFVDYWNYIYNVDWNQVAEEIQKKIVEIRDYKE